MNLNILEVILIILGVALLYRLGLQPEYDKPLLNITVTSPYDPEDALIWRTLEDATFACFPLEE